MIEIDAKVLGVIRRTPTVKSFRFEIKKDIIFKPGQYFVLTIDVNGQKQSKPFSFSSSPTEKGYIEFTKRLTDSDFSRALNNLKPGDHGHLRLPLGNFTFEGEHPKIALLSGGIGVTPFRSICKNASDKKMVSDILLLYGNKNTDEIIFKEDFDDIAGVNDNFRVVYYLSGSETTLSREPFRQGYIDECSIKRDVSDLTQRVFYLCGPPKMVQDLKRILEVKLSIPVERIKTENFNGY